MDALKPYGIVDDFLGPTGSHLQTKVLVDLLRVALQAIERYDKAIAAIAPTLPDYALFSALPGAGPTLAPRLLVGFGEQRDHFQGADELQKYAGIAPITERSGNKSWVHWRWQWHTFLWQTLVEWAAKTINKSYWAGAFIINNAIRDFLATPLYEP